MNGKTPRLDRTLLTVLFLGAGMSAIAQMTTPPSAPAGPAPKSPTLAPNPSLPPLNSSGVPPLNSSGTSAAPLAPAPMTGQLPTRSDDALTAFRSLDTANRGYVTRAETDRIQGFVGFDNADSNRDGQLTYEEFQNAWKFYAQ